MKLDHPRNRLTGRHNIFPFNVMELFPVERKYPRGFEYYAEFISAEEELSLVSIIRGIELHTFNFQGYEAKRRVASFGYDYNFTNRKLIKGRDVPSGFDPLVQRVSQHLGIAAERIAELLVTEYPVGSVINWHRDAPPFDVIAGISLASDCMFRLRPHRKEQQVRGSIINVPVKRRSLYVIAGDARTNWQHSISPVKDVRYSITLRTLI